MTATTANVVTARDSLLRNAIRADAVISGLTGLAGLAFARNIAEISGTTAAFEFIVSASFVVIGAVFLGLSMRASVRSAGRVLAIGNLIFAVVAIVFVLIKVFPLTTTGVVLTIGTAAYTAVIGVVQYIGLRRIG
ncbi:hypothetical protein [Mycolicibacterium arenosum]|uniref:Integral membrane protein n=1 Tax=Mycolicibacterium arenosum TaxID=2952157 RepID=A0ABT1LUX2_9MYCO|nr:hypothetical protein [Mycolicibacterium sp. CAU 1645]MCP9270700.1 hypothetical protein [Mycolicibacterium sp. CAU 1645]